jgi:hypothetical protein
MPPGDYSHCACARLYPVVASLLPSNAEPGQGSYKYWARLLRVHSGGNFCASGKDYYTIRKAKLDSYGR